MGMNIDEIIAKEKEMAQTFQKIVDTQMQMVSEDVSSDEMYCGDSEMFEKALKRYQELADYHNQIANIICKYRIPQADYNARLKADMVCILQKLKSEIDNMPKYYPYTDHSRWYIDGDVFGAIQKEINSLKENKDE